MKKIRPIFIWWSAAVFLLFLAQFTYAEQVKAQDKAGDAVKSQGASPEGLVTDPVCGMKINPKSAAAKVEYKGKTYYFCMESDKQAFEKDPEKYITKGGKQGASGAVHQEDQGMQSQPQVTPLKNLEVITPMQEDHHEVEGHEHQHDMAVGEHWMAPEGEAKKTNPVQPAETSVTKGQELFKQKCVLCHGEGAKGDGPLADTLDPKPSDLTGGMAASHPDGDLFYKISKGRGAMPAWESVFSEDERWNLVNFIRSLSKANESGDKPDKK